MYSSATCVYQLQPYAGMLLLVGPELLLLGEGGLEKQAALRGAQAFSKTLIFPR